ncbi:hypothetical protein [Aeromicrobium sp.]|uniref:hypothetical protein n=1 Tax=Aeromicrobium sp. TaxID=1871063 RepID=UPI0025BA2ED0|nr:hypothetical protein [Aeromicrobium sp.]
MTIVDTGEATRTEATGPAYDSARAAFTELLEAFSLASVLVTGVEDPDTRAHGANEVLHLAEFERVVLAATLLLARLGQG